MPTTATNKIEFGLSQCKFAKLTKTVGADGAITNTYAAPVPLVGIQSMTLDPEGDTTNIYADDNVYFNYTANNGYSGELVFAYLSEAIQEALYGISKTAGGTVLERADILPNEGAILYQCQGDAKKSRHILYDVTFGNPSLEPKTKEDGIEATVVTIPYTAVPLELTGGERVTKGRVMEGADDYDDFFTAVEAPTIAAA